MHAAGVEPDVEFITVSSYGAGTQAGTVKLLRDIDSDVRDATCFSSTIFSNRAKRSSSPAN